MKISEDSSSSHKLSKKALSKAALALSNLRTGVIDVGALASELQDEARLEDGVRLEEVLLASSPSEDSSSSDKLSKKALSKAALALRNFRTGVGEARLRDEVEMDLTADEAVVFAMSFVVSESGRLEVINGRREDDSNRNCWRSGKCCLLVDSEGVVGDQEKEREMQTTKSKST